MLQSVYVLAHCYFVIFGLYVYDIRSYVSYEYGTDAWTLRRRVWYLRKVLEVLVTGTLVVSVVIRLDICISLLLSLEETIAKLLEKLYWMIHHDCLTT